LTGHSIIVAGIPLPSDAPVFLTILAVHVSAGLICLISGIVAMRSHKGRGRHPSVGSIYHWALFVVFLSMAALSAIRWSDDYELFILGFLSFFAASVGRMARRRRWQFWVPLHISGMGTSYILLLTAFYVDNGRNLPLWRELPQLAFWILPSAFGAPILLHALLRHPMARRTK
jgi:hypothetical protein